MAISMPGDGSLAGIMTGTRLAAGLDGLSRLATGRATEDGAA
jgi:hypothetical protein